MTDDRVTRRSSPVSPGNQTGANPTSDASTHRLPLHRPPIGSAKARPNPIPVRRAAVNPAAPPAPSVTDAHTEELPVMTDEEFEAAIAAAQRSARAAREAEAAATPAPDEGPGEAAPRRRSLLAGTAGVLTAATVLIALIAIAAQVYSSVYGKPGPGWRDVAGQTVLAILAVLLQRRVDRRTRGRARRGWAVLGVVGMAVLSFGVFWWAWLWLFWPV